MRHRFSTITVGCGLGLVSVTIAAQAQAPASAPAGSVVVAKPTYVTIPMEITINRPIAEVWKRVGGYCDVVEWFQIADPCRITAGTDREVGAVRTVGSGVEVFVGKTEYSYTYAQIPRAGTPYNLYHATVEARAMSPTTTKVLYTLVFDNSMLPDDAARQADVERRRDRFTQGLRNMKILAEGGTLPPPPPPTR